MAFSLVQRRGTYEACFCDLYTCLKDPFALSERLPGVIATIPSLWYMLEGPISTNAGRIRSPCGFKWVILSNGMGWSGFYVNMDWGGLKWILYAKQYDYI